MVFVAPTFKVEFTLEIVHHMENFLHIDKKQLTKSKLSFDFWKISNISLNKLPIAQIYTEVFSKNTINVVILTTLQNSSPATLFSKVFRTPPMSGRHWFISHVVGSFTLRHSGGKKS